ncbi:MAG: glycosyltransferase [Opitutaceae bacterium]
MNLLVITPTLGKSATLMETIASITAVDRELLHLVVVPSVAHDSLRGRYPRLRVVADAGQGLYAALNAGLAAASGERWDWFTYINDDDVWTEGMRSSLQQAADAGSSCAVVYGRVGLIDACARDLGELPVAHFPDDLLKLLVRGIVPLAQPGTLIHRRVIEQLSGFDASYRSAGDLDAFVRALTVGVRFEFVNRTVAAFRLHSGQISKNEKDALREKARALLPLHAHDRQGGRMAMLRFRLSNLGVYARRIRRFGFMRMKEIYRHA